MTSDIPALKRAWRQDALAARMRAAAEPGFTERAAHGIAAHGMAFLKERGVLEGGRLAVVSGFWPMGEEIDLRPLMTLLHDAGHGIALPVVAGKGLPLIFRAWRPETVLVPGVFGTETPGTNAPECVPDILLVPLLAFGRDGARLGYGGGFYDRTLRALRRAKPVQAIGTAYACQEREGIPMAAWDERLDAVLTEHGVVGTIG